MFKKKPVIEFRAMEEGLEHIAPIRPARDFLPDWWNKLSINHNVRFVGNTPMTGSTVKRCMGIHDFLHAGYVMPLWCDLHITATPENIGWTSSDRDYVFKVHPNNQMLDFIPEEARSRYVYILKCVAPWLVRTSRGYSVMLMNPFYFFNEYFDAAYGMAASDSHCGANTFLMIKKYGDFIIEKGTPVGIFFPFKREKFREVTYPLCDKTRKIYDSCQRMLNSQFSRLKSYNALRKCPFHFD